MYGDFILLEKDNEDVVRAERLAFGETAGRDEAWLRDTIYAHPELLPIKDIDPSFGPLVPLCKELRTEAGPLDAAFINSHGRLTLVECKLWRNPEARRKVVAQVLDYARAVSRWTYSDLQRQVAAARGQKGNIPYELVRPLATKLLESRFVDNASNAMRSGRFLLVIAGDGIREDISGITELINRNAASGFSFALVEVALYGLNDGGLIVQPRTIAKTQTIERTVVMVRDGDKSQFLLQGEEEETETTGEATDVGNQLGESPKQAEYREWWTPILNMQFDDPEQEPPKLYYPNHVRAALPIPKTWVTAWRGGGDGGVIGVFTSGSGNSYREMITNLAMQCDEILKELPEGSIFKKSEKGGHFSIGKSANDFSNEDEKRKWLISMLNAYINILRPRLKQIT